jgi:ankyrin repeat protein
MMPHDEDQKPSPSQLSLISKTAPLASQESIIRAAAAGDNALVRSLAIAGGNVNTVDGCGWPSLHRAALSFDVKTVLTVLEYGAPVNMRGPEGRTALMIESQWGHCKMIRTLLKAGILICLCFYLSSDFLWI